VVRPRPHMSGATDMRTTGSINSAKDLLSNRIESVLGVLCDRYTFFEEALHLVHGHAEGVPEEDTRHSRQRIRASDERGTDGLPKTTFVSHGANMTGRRCWSQILACSSIEAA
jgi:hypothetical protein